MYAAFVVCHVVQISLCRVAKQMKNKFFKIESNCDYLFSYGRKPVYSKREKCSNHLARCEVTKCSNHLARCELTKCSNHLARCEVTKCSNHLARCEVTKCSNHLARCEVTKFSVEWKYHMSQHYKECHNLMAFPEELKISKQEKMYICIQNHVEDN